MGADVSPDIAEGSVREGTAVLARRWLLATRLQDGPVLDVPSLCFLALFLAGKLSLAVFWYLSVVSFPRGVEAALVGLEGESIKRGRSMGMVFAVREQRRDLLLQSMPEGCMDLFCDRPSTRIQKPNPGTNLYIISSLTVP